MALLAIQALGLGTEKEKFPALRYVAYNMSNKRRLMGIMRRS